MLNFARLVLAVLAFIQSINSQLLPSAPIVQLDNGGSLEGTTLYSADGKLIDAFLSIPYAQPPLGALRFADPQPASDWVGIKKATERPSACFQNDLLGGSNSVLGSEDCLYLNVFTPRDRVNQPVLSVMVFFHGGSFFIGSSDPLFYGPERLVDRNIVLVTVNYRLGVLGFLSTMNSYSPGNYGLKDQNLALKWVQEHISNFGGNPNDVTIFGQSAGAASVSFHMIAPASEGLFHKAILQSGNYFNPWAIIPAQKAIGRARQLAQSVSCSVPADENYDPMIQCLRQVDAGLLIANQIQFFVFPTGDPSTIFGPVIEPELPNTFLGTHPKDITSSYGDEIPVIIGCTAEEGAFRSGVIIKLYSDAFAANFDLIVPSIVGYDDLSPNEQTEITERIKDFYFKNGFDWSLMNSRNLTNLYSDIGFYAGMEQFLKKRRKTANADTYAYIFDHNPPKSTTEFYGAGTDFFGVAHGDELPFLFPFGQLALLYSKRNRQMESTMTGMWTDFAKTGDPTPTNSPVIEKWKKIGRFPYRYALIGSKYLPKTDKYLTDPQYENGNDTNMSSNIPDENNNSNQTKKYFGSIESAEDDYSKSDVAHINEENSVIEETLYNKHLGRRSKVCQVYSKRKNSCRILKNRSDRFWSGFYYWGDS